MNIRAKNKSQSTGLDVARFLPMFVAGLIAILTLHALGVGNDMLAVLRYPFELDYGEGIVWQQAVLVPGPHMYATWQDRLPFIVFHYPPVYYLLVHIADLATPNLLVAGRLVSEAATLVAAILVGILVAAATPARSGEARYLRWGIILATSLLVLSLHAVRRWGMVMRVDMVGIMFSLTAVAIAVRWRGLAATALSLLLCVASFYTKQTEVAAGMAIFLIAAVQSLRLALWALIPSLLAGVGVLGLMQRLTAGGFLQNVVGGNINRMSIANLRDLYLSEANSGLMMLVMLFALGWLLYHWGFGCRMAGLLGRIRLGCEDPIGRARALLLLYFVFAIAILIPTGLKSGASYNYFLDCFGVGTVLVGALMCDLLDYRRCSLLLTGLIIIFVAWQPFYQWSARLSQYATAVQEPLLRRIAEAKKPIASDDMVIVMQAGKPIIFEPAIVTELASVGAWDEKPVLDMVREHGFAFIITSGNKDRWTKAFDEAMHQAYPRVIQSDPLHWVHLPAD